LAFVSGPQTTMPTSRTEQSAGPSAAVRNEDPPVPAAVSIAGAGDTGSSDDTNNTNTTNQQQSAATATTVVEQTLNTHQEEHSTAAPTIMDVAAQEQPSTSAEMSEDVPNGEDEDEVENTTDGANETFGADEANEETDEHKAKLQLSLEELQQLIDAGWSVKAGSITWKVIDESVAEPLPEYRKVGVHSFQFKDFHTWRQF